MAFHKKTFAAFIVLVIVTGTALAFSGLEIGGTYLGKVPWWCTKYPVYEEPKNTSQEVPPENSSGDRGRGVPFIPGGYIIENPTPGMLGGGRAFEPDSFRKYNSNPIKDSLKEKLKKLNESSEATSGGSRDGSSGSQSGDTIRNGGSGVSIPGVKVPGLPGGGSEGSDDTPSGEITPKDGYWEYQLVCPKDSYVDHQKLDKSCTRIKFYLDSGKYTEDTLPPEMKKLLPGCKRYGSWFTVPPQSDDDCDAIITKNIIYGWNSLTGEEVSKLDYCYKMKPDSENKTWKKFEDDCVAAKKSGKPLSPEMKKACGDNFGWWSTSLSPNECKEIFKTIASYTALGGDICELDSGAKIDGCFDVYPELNTSGAKQCGKGGGMGGGG